MGPPSRVSWKMRCCARRWSQPTSALGCTADAITEPLFLIREDLHMTCTTPSKVLAGAVLLIFAVCESGCGDNQKIAPDAAPIPRACLDPNAATVTMAALHTLNTQGS